MFKKRVSAEAEAAAQAKAARFEAEALLAEAKLREAAAAKAARKAARKGPGFIGYFGIAVVGFIIYGAATTERPKPARAPAVARAEAPVAALAAERPAVAQAEPEAPAPTREARQPIRCDELTGRGSVLFNMYSNATCEDGPVVSPARQASEPRPVARPAELVVAEAAVPTAQTIGDTEDTAIASQDIGESEAMFRCTKIVEGSFRYRFSRNWSGFSVKTIDNGDTIEMRSTYTAQNGFGAERQIPTYCAVFPRSGEMWVTVDSRTVYEGRF